MRCRAAVERRETRTLEMTRLYGMKCLAAIQSELGLLLLDTYPWFRTRAERVNRLQEFFDQQTAICESELNEKAAEKIRVKDRSRGWHEADRDEAFEETVDDAAFRLERDLNYSGIDAEAVYTAAEGYLPDKEYFGEDRLHADARAAWYAWLGRRAIRVWISSAGIALTRFRLPSGRRRFSIVSVERDIVMPLARFASDWVSDFMGGHDGQRDREQAARLRRLREVYGIEMRTPEYKIGEESVPLKIRAAEKTITEPGVDLSRFEAILGERKGFGGVERRIIR